MEETPETVFQTFSVAEAELARTRLEAAGFLAGVTHELAALSMEGYSMAAGGVKVQVPASQAAEAREFLARSSLADEAGPAGPPA